MNGLPKLDKIVFDQIQVLLTERPNVLSSLRVALGVPQRSAKGVTIDELKKGKLGRAFVVVSTPSGYEVTNYGA